LPDINKLIIDKAQISRKYQEIYSRVSGEGDISPVLKGKKTLEASRSTQPP
jgi:hypothetical protein